jgi:hypothetical protein
MDSAELSEWYVQWSRVAPFGDEWRQTGAIIAMNANSNPFRSAESKVFIDEDFMPIPRKEEKPFATGQPPTDQVDLARMVHRALGG